MSFLTIPLVRIIYGGDDETGALLFRGTADILISFVLPALAVVAFWVARGATPGKMAISAQVVDARTGEVLLPATKIRAETPAWSGARMKAARAKGITQKSMITNHVAATIAGWLGLGPDNRGTFSRQGN